MTAVGSESNVTEASMAVPVTKIAMDVDMLRTRRNDPNFLSPTTDTMIITEFRERVNCRDP